jgi:small subunit ribosomal protein S16
MVVIRLARSGSKKKPFYNVVATDRRFPRDGRFIEKIGFYNPVARGQEIALHLSTEKYDSWINKGAQPSARVSSLYALWLKNDAKDLEARTPKTTRTPIDLNDKPDQRKPKVVEEAVSEEKVSEEVVSEETTNEEVVSEEKTSEEVVSEETTNEEVVSEEKATEEVVSEETTNEKTVSEEKASKK